jgi:endonuclease G
MGATFHESYAEQRRSAAERVEAGASERRKRSLAPSRPGGIVEADTPERIASRIDRLSRYYSDVRPINPCDVAAEKPEAMEAARAVLERMIKTQDFVDVRYRRPGYAPATRWDESTSASKDA